MLADGCGQSGTVGSTDGPGCVSPARRTTHDRTLIMYDPEEILGGYDSLVQIIDDDVAFLLTKGVTAATIKAPLVANRGILSEDKRDRNNKKASLAGSQTKFENDGNSLYDALSDAIDSLAGIFGKKTPKGKQILAIRTGIVKSKRRQNRSSSSSTSGGGSSSSS